MTVDCPLFPVLILFFFNPTLTNNIDKFVEFPKDIHVARQEKFLGHAFFPIL